MVINFIKRNCGTSSIIIYMYTNSDNHTIHVHWRQNYPQTIPFHSFNMCSSSNRPVFFYNRKAKNLLNRICEEGQIPESLVRDISFNKHELLNQQGQLLLLGQRTTCSWAFITANKTCVFLLVVGVVLWLVLDVAASCCSRWTSNRNYDSSQ